MRSGILADPYASHEGWGRFYAGQFRFTGSLHGLASHLSHTDAIFARRCDPDCQTVRLQSGRKHAPCWKAVSDGDAGRRRLGAGRLPRASGRCRVPHRRSALGAIPRAGRRIAPSLTACRAFARSRRQGPPAPPRTTSGRERPVPFPGRRTGDGHPTGRWWRTIYASSLTCSSGSSS